MKSLMMRTNKSLYGLRLVYAKFRNTIIYKYLGIKYLPVSYIVRLLAIDKIINKKIRHDIPEDLTLKFSEIYKEDNKKLEKHLNMDLVKYNYCL